ncbi:MAG: hypothetical protein LBB07_02895 [Bifidobacteriaceae bacterium]|jgi:hypothetical protein|nr:hypothetical protein [Bifidobacteriaceae bacterium]
MKLINFRKIGTVLAVAVFGFISFTAGVDLTQNANSAGSASVLPILKGGTGANNAADARTNLGVSSTTEMNSAISNAADWRVNSPYIWLQTNYELYTKIFDNIENAAYTSTYTFYFEPYHASYYAAGTVTLSTIKANDSTDEIHITSALWCPVRNYLPSTSTANFDQIYFAVYKNGGIYSLWVKDAKLTPWKAFVSSKIGQYYSTTYQSVRRMNTLLSNTSTTGAEGNKIYDWVQLITSCGTMPPSPAPIPTTSSTP